MPKKYTLPSTPLFHTMLQQVARDAHDVANAPLSVAEHARLGMCAALLLGELAKAVEVK